MLLTVLAGCTTVFSTMSEKPEVPSKHLVLSDRQPDAYRVSEQKISYLRRLVKQRPNDIDALLGLAKSLRQSGKAAEALGILEAKSRAYTKNSGFLAEFGKAALATGNSQRAISLIKSAINNGAGSWQNYSALGIAYDFERSHDQANKIYDIALKLSPGNSTVMNNKAVSALLMGNVDKAIAMLEKLSASSSRKLWTRRNLVLFREIRDRLKKCPGSRRECREIIIQEVGSTIYGITRVKASPTPPPAKKRTRAVQNIIEKLNSTSTAQSVSAIDMKVNFEFASAVLTPEAKNTLNSLGQALTSEELAGQRFLLEGHTDAVGSNEYNQVLSEDRARSVKDYLVATFHIEPSHLETAGYGESRLLDPSNPFSDVNRRVRISVVADK